MRNWNSHIERVMRKCEHVFGTDNVTFTSSAPVPVGETAPEPVTLRAVFDKAHHMTDTEGNVPVSQVMPVVDVRSEDLPWTPQEGDLVEVDGEKYTVFDPQPDGAGTWRLYLHSGQITRW